ncbi:MAG: lytic transglycosylase domain-containing protein [Bacteroidota bacterium]
MLVRFSSFVGLALLLALFSCQPAESPSPAEDLRHLAGHMTVMQRGLPAELSFCTNEVPLQDQAIRKRLLREVKQHLDYPSGARLLYKRAHRYQDRFLRILRSQGVPEDFFYLAMAESGLANLKSPVGARGFWQFMPSTAQQYGLEVSATVDERYHPEAATYAACRYLKSHHRTFGDWALVAASYNMGGGGLSKAMRKQQEEDYFALELNRETGRYLYRILSHKILMEFPEDFGIDVTRQDLYQPIRYRVVEVSENIPDLATFAKAHNSSYLMLKTLNPWLIADHLEATPGKTYEVRFPMMNEVYAQELLVESYVNPDKVEREEEPMETPAPEADEDLATDNS